MKTLINILALLSAQAFALDAFYLPYTKHLAPCYEECPYADRYNEENHVIGATSGKYSAFVMKNSYNKYGIFVGRQWQKDFTANIRGFGVIGGVTGYSDVSKNIFGIAPAAYVGVDIHTEDSKWGIVITGVPTPGGVFNIGFRLSL